MFSMGFTNFYKQSVVSASVENQGLAASVVNEVTRCLLPAQALSRRRRSTADGSRSSTNTGLCTWSSRSSKVLPITPSTYHEHVRRRVASHQNDRPIRGLRTGCKGPGNTRSASASRSFSCARTKTATPITIIAPIITKTMAMGPVTSKSAFPKV